jgi:hypothetical protein
MQQLTPELLSEERLKKFVDNETFLLGLHLYQEKRAALLELSEQKANCVVNDVRPQNVEILLTPSHLLMKCNCPHASRGLVCEHGVASWLHVRDHLRQNDFPQWRRQLSEILEQTRLETVQKRIQPYLLFFSLQENLESTYMYFQWRPYIITVSAIDKESQEKLAAAKPEEIERLVYEHPLLKARLKVPASPLSLEGCLNQDIQTVSLANIMISQERFFVSGTSFDDFLALLSEKKTPVYLGNPKFPLGTSVKLVSEPGILRLRISRGKNEVIIRPRIVIGNDYYYPQPGEFTLL